MYYKIINTESEVYKKMASLLAKEKEINESNKKALAEKIPYKWDKFFGRSGQQSFGRTNEYCGFFFLEPEKVDNRIWRQGENGMFFPNRKTKAGREMSDFLRNRLRSSWYQEPLEILGCNHHYRRFKFPFVEQCNDVIVLFLDNQHIPVSDDVIEITSKEFNYIRDRFWKK